MNGECILTVFFFTYRTTMLEVAAFWRKQLSDEVRSYGGVIPIEESQENKTTRAGINNQRQHMREFRHFIRKYLN